jgi:hypothetical protein
MNSGACEKQALPVSHKKSTILLIVKIDKSLVSDRLTEERKKSISNGKHPLAFGM